MKTYKPKKPAYKEIEHIDELCRLCLEKAEDGVAIFKDDQDVCAAVALRFMICVGLELKQEQWLPNMICKNCYADLENYYKFRKKCQMSYQKLQYHVLALKLKTQKQVHIPLDKHASETVDCETVEIKQDENDVKEVQLHDPQTILIENDTENLVEKKEVLQPELTPDISTFLSGILMELGILSHERGLLQHHGVSTVELETGDQEFTLDLVEEDEETAVISPAEETSEPDDLIIEVKPCSTITKRNKKSSPWCAVCLRAFSSESALARHTRAHSGARPHVCARCGAAFAQKAVLQRHMLVHLDVRPHRCSLCSKSFTQRSALAAHARTHAPPNVRPLALHRCAACCKVFLYASGLSRHMLSHSGRVLACSACDKRFQDRSSLTRHLRHVCKARPPARLAAHEPAEPTPQH